MMQKQKIKIFCHNGIYLKNENIYDLSQFKASIA